MRVSVLEGHRVWAPVYDTSINPLLALETRILKNLLSPVASKLFIDVACGTGRWTAYLRARGATVFGVDLSPEMLAEANGKTVLKGRLVLSDAARLALRTAAADVTLCSFAAGYLQDLPGAIREMSRVTRRGGTVILSDLHPAALQAGWTRSFRSGSHIYEIDHSSPSIDDFKTAAQQSHLQFQTALECSLGEPERPLFRAAAKEHMLEAISTIPALWIGIWQKL